MSKRTTLLVVGDQDIRWLAGHDKSAKHRKAEALIAKGQAIRILQEQGILQQGQSPIQRWPAARRAQHCATDG